MIHLEFQNIETLRQMHYGAVLDYVSQRMKANDVAQIYDNIRNLPLPTVCPKTRNESDFTWLKEFILADTHSLKNFVTKYSNFLKFDQFRRLYNNRFSKSPSVFVDRAATYNSYTLFNSMGIKVCPYCEHEYIEVLNRGESKSRSMEFDHFYPKGDAHYPGLAMCFYNLIPSCRNCNHTKMEQPLTANPYDPAIESLTSVYPDIMDKKGIIYSTVSDDDCAISFHAKGEMVTNESTLCLEQRYQTLRPEVHRLLMARQLWPHERLDEFKRMGFDIQPIIKSLFGNPSNVSKGKELHTKMKKDTIGY